MKKINALGITLLCGTILTMNVTSVLNVNAVQNSTIESTSNESYVAQLQAVIDAAKPYVDYTKYEKGAVDTLKLFIEQAEDDIANGYVSEVTIQSQIDSIQGSVELVKNSPLDTTSSSSTESTTNDTTTNDTTTNDTTTNDTTTNDTTTNDTTTNNTTTNDTTTNDTTTNNTTTNDTTTNDTTTNDTTSSSSTEELKPTINVSDKTMYVGDKLTEEDILNWATFENADGLLGGFEVIGEPILVSQLDNTLIKSGTHQINFFIEGKTRTTENYIAEKTITLTIKDKGTTDTTTSNSSDGTMNTSTSTSTSDISATKTTPVGKVKTIKSETKVLPKTGDTASSSLVLLGTVTLISGVYVINIKRKKSDNEI